MRVVLAMLISSVMPAWAPAQTSLPANDFHGAIGFSGADHEHLDSRQWYGSALAGLSVGHYWSDQAKTEVEAAWNSLGSRELFEVTVEFRTRMPEPARRFTYDQIQQLEPKTNGSSIAKAAAVGSSIGAGTFLGLLALFATTWD